MMIVAAKRKNTRVLKYGTIFIFISFFIFTFLFFGRNIRGNFYSFAEPTQAWLWSAGNSMRGIFSFFSKNSELQQQINDLKFKNNALLFEVASLQTLRGENDMMRKSLGLELNKDFKLSIVNITSKDISKDVVLVDKGFADGISKDMAVITEDKIAVGRVSGVYKNFSKITLISDKESYFDANIPGKDVSGMVKGNGNFAIIFDLVPRDKEVAKGDVIVTSSLGGIFPAGLLIGEISEIEKNDLDPFQKIKINNFFDINKASSLFVIIK